MIDRMVYHMQAARLHTPQIVLIDPDKVETKNVGRQLYTEADVGQPKAHVLMRRFNIALGLDIVAIDQPSSMLFMLTSELRDVKRG